MNSDDEFKLIGVKSDVKKLLDKRKVIPRESYNDVISRLVNNSNKRGNSQKSASQV